MKKKLSMEKKDLDFQHRIMIKDAGIKKAQKYKSILRELYTYAILKRKI